MSYIFLFFQCFLSLFLCYSSAVSVYLSFLKGRHFDFLTVFFILTLVSFTLFSIWQIYQTVKQFYKQTSKSETYPLLIKKKIKRNKKILILLIFCIINFLFGFFSVHTQYSRGLDVSEAGQLSASRSPHNIIEVAYNQQQPPLDYYFSSFSNELWGQNKFSVRFHTMMFYLIVSLILPLMIWFFCPSFWPVIFGSLLFSINHIIRIQSVNGRPLSLTLFTGFLFLFFYMAYCKNSQSKKQNSLFPVLASQYLFIMSIGFQPVVFIISLFISSFYLLFKGKKIIFKKLFLSHILTALFTLPVYIKMFSFGQDAHKFNRFSFKKIIHYMENYNALNLFEKHIYSFYEQLLFSFLLLVIGLVTVVFIRKKLSNLTAQMGCTLIVFPLLFDFLFEMMINWKLWDWYFIVYSLFLIFFCTSALNDILLYLKEKSWKAHLLLIPAVLLLAWNTFSQIITIKHESQFWTPYRSNDIEQAYNYLQQRGDPSDFAVEISLMPISLGRSADMNYMESFFHKSNHHPKMINYFLQMTDTPPFFYERDGTEIPYINWNEVPRQKNQKVFFIVNHTAVEDKAHSVFSSFMEETKIGRFSIFKWTLKTKNREKEYKEFLSRLIDRIPQKYQPVLYETLLYYACKNKDKNHFYQLLKKYRRLKSSFDRFNSNYNTTKIDSYFLLRRRADYFENMNYCNEGN